MCSVTGALFGATLSSACSGSDNDNAHGASSADAGSAGISALAGNTFGGGSAGNSAAKASEFPQVVIPEVPKEQLGDKVFDENQVLSYYLEFSPAEYAKLMDLSTLLKTPWEVNQDRYVEASLRVGDIELPKIAVRFKGNYSITGCVDNGTGKRAVRVEPLYGNVDVCQRFSLKLDFDRYVDRFRVDGLKKLNLHAMAADPSKMRDRLGYSLFRDTNIVAPRAVHARVYFNGEYQGVFAAIENLDGRFAAKHFPESPDGNLYKQSWPTKETTTASAKEALRTNEDVGDVSDMMSFRDAVLASTEADFAARIAAFVDLDYLARYFVVDRGIANFDGPISFYFGVDWGPYNQNYYWYGQSGHFSLIPWDFDKAFLYPEPNFWSNNAPNGLNVVPNWNVVTNKCTGYECYFDSVNVVNGTVVPASYGVREIDCDPFLKLLRGAVYDRQRSIADTFIAGSFSEASVTEKLERWRSQIASAMAEDPLIPGPVWQAGIDQLRTDLPKFQANLKLMMSGLVAQ